MIEYGAYELGTPDDQLSGIREVVTRINNALTEWLTKAEEANDLGLLHRLTPTLIFATMHDDPDNPEQVVISSTMSGRTSDVVDAAIRLCMAAIIGNATDAEDLTGMLSAVATMYQRRSVEAAHAWFDHHDQAGGGHDD